MTMGMKPNAIKPLAQLAWAMMKTGILGYGGGPSVIPLIRHEAVRRCRWMSDEEFAEILALANILPGPIATKMAAYLGYRIRGWIGASVAVLAHILPTAIAVIVLLTTFSRLSGLREVQGMIAAVVPVIAVMLGMMAYEFGEKAVRGLGGLIGTLGFAIAFLLLVVLSVHPAPVTLLFLVYGAVHLRLMERLKARRRRNMNRE